MNRDARQILTELLVLKAQGGDDHAFSELYELWAPDLRRLAMVEVERAGPADDVAQDAWVTIAKSLRRLDDPACFPSWAFRILKRRCADWIRRQQLDRIRADALATTVADETHPLPYSEPDTVIVLREVIGRLDRDARTLLHLFYEQEFPVAEIAEVLDVPVGTVKSRLFALRETLKQKLERISSS